MIRRPLLRWSSVEAILASIAGVLKRHRGDGWYQPHILRHVPPKRLERITFELGRLRRAERREEMVIHRDRIKAVVIGPFRCLAGLGEIAGRQEQAQILLPMHERSLLIVRLA